MHQCTCGGLSSVRLARPVKLGFCCLRMPNTRSAGSNTPQASACMRCRKGQVTAAMLGVSSRVWRGLRN